MKYLAVLLLCVLFGYPSFLMAKNFNLEQDEKYTSLTEKNNKLLQDNVELNQIYNNLNTLKSIIKSSRFDLLLYEKIASDLNRDISNIETIPLDQLTPRTGGLPFILDFALLSDLINKPYLITQEIINNINASNIEDNNIKEAIKLHTAQFSPPAKQKSIIHLYKLKDGIEDESISSQEQQLELTAKAKNEINAESFKNEFKINLDDMLSKLNTYQNTIKNFITINNDRINKNKLEITKIVVLANKLNPTTFSIGMYIVVGGMIVAVLIMFLSLILSSKNDTVKDILAKRTLIEIVSISFILLTMIILGTGQKIGGETLGALLGTIAGYIFGKSSRNLP